MSLLPFARGFLFFLRNNCLWRVVHHRRRNAAPGAASPSEEPPVFIPQEENPDEISKGYILLDPGHGSEGSPGSVYGGILERDVTLDLSLLIRDELAKRGYTVEMTREVDITVPIEERTEMANKSGADLLLSIHLNAHEDTGVFGIETWFNPKTNPKSSTLAQYVSRRLPPRPKERTGESIPIPPSF